MEAGHLEHEKQMQRPTLGLALSGGGHRASAWALGVILYLVDSGEASMLESVASVSGGSITNGVVAAGWDLKAGDATEFAARVAAPLALRIARTGTVFKNRKARDVKHLIVALAVTAAGCLLALVLFTIGAVVATALDAGALSAELHELGSWLAIAFVIALAALFAVFIGRGEHFTNGYDDELFGGRLLSKIDSAVEHVFCATDMQFAEHVYLSSQFVYAYRLGVSAPLDLRIADAVAASAAFPGAFPPVRIRTSALRFEFGAEPLPTHLVLLDGGIYDNMGEQWLTGIPKRLSGLDGDAQAGARAARLRQVTKLQGRPDELIVANGSPSYPRKDMGLLSSFQVELRALFQFPLALHDNSTSLRRNYLVTSFMARGAGAMRGTLVHIGTDPWRGVESERSRLAAIAAATPKVTNPNSDRSREALVDANARLLESRLGENKSAVDWAELRDRNCNVGTVLDPLGEETTADLLQHAYVLTAVQMSLYLGRSLPPEGEWLRLFGRKRFSQLVRGNATG